MREDLTFLQKELENARRALFMARSVRELKCIQHRIQFLKQRIREARAKAQG